MLSDSAVPSGTSEANGHRPAHDARFDDLTISLIIPVMDEALGLRRVLPAVPPWVDDIVIVDGGSDDGTDEVVAELCPQARFLLQQGRGKGGAIKEGIHASAGEVIVTMDGDGSMDPSDIAPAIELLLQGNDFVKGSRELDWGGSADFTTFRRIGNRMLTSVTNTLFGRRWTDITYGFNAYWREIVCDLAPLADDFAFEIQAAVQASRAGLRTAEVPCWEAPRVAGESKLHSVRDGAAILKVLVGEATPRASSNLRRMTDRTRGEIADRARHLERVS